MGALQKGQEQNVAISPWHLCPRTNQSRRMRDSQSVRGGPAFIPVSTCPRQGLNLAGGQAAHPVPSPYSESLASGLDRCWFRGSVCKGQMLHCFYFLGASNGPLEGVWEPWPLPPAPRRFFYFGFFAGTGTRECLWSLKAPSRVPQVCAASMGSGNFHGKTS